MMIAASSGQHIATLQHVMCFESIAGLNEHLGAVVLLCAAGSLVGMGSFGTVHKGELGQDMSNTLVRGNW